MSARPWDGGVIGGGIVGLATALALAGRAPGLRLVVLEKGPRLAAHQSSHNSGVIHTGIYYTPGSTKARLCVEGGKLLLAFCEQHGVRHARCGKVVVAGAPADGPRLERLYERGMANGVEGGRRSRPERLRELEPHAAGVRGPPAPDRAG